MINTNQQILTITKEADFKEIDTLVRKVFLLEGDIPDQVFNPPFDNFLFQEFDWALTPNFWDSAIQPFSLALEDAYVVVAVLEPNPVNYFYQNFGYYNWFKYPPTINGRDYWKILEKGPKESPADALLFNSETIVWLPASLKWAVWGNRSYGLCIIAFQDNETKIKLTSFLKSWKSAAVALNSFIGVNFQERKIPLEFRDSFMQNYSELGKEI